MFTFLIKILVESTSNIAPLFPLEQSFGIQKATETITMDRYIKLTSILFPISGKNSKNTTKYKIISFMTFMHCQHFQLLVDYMLLFMSR